MNALTLKLAEALQILRVQTPNYKDGDGAVMFHAQNIADEALRDFKAIMGSAARVTSESQDEADGVRLPWALGEVVNDQVEILDIDACVPVVAQKMGADFHEGSLSVATATARRVIACVNACSGVPTQVLEEIAGLESQS